MGSVPFPEIFPPQPHTTVYVAGVAMRIYQAHTHTNHSFCAVISRCVCESLGIGGRIAKEPLKYQEKGGGKKLWRIPQKSGVGGEIYGESPKHKVKDSTEHLLSIRDSGEFFKHQLHVENKIRSF